MLQKITGACVTSGPDNLHFAVTLEQRKLQASKTRAVKGL
jgi:hypothetical protein